MSEIRISNTEDNEKFYVDWCRDNPDFAELMPVFNPLVHKKVHDDKDKSYTEYFYAAINAPINTKTKQAGIVKLVASNTNSAAQAVTGSKGIAGIGYVAATGGVVVISSTGIGLLVIGGVLTVVSCGFALKSARRTDLHILALKDIFRNHDKYQCVGHQAIYTTGHKNDGMTHHDMILKHVLPYIIQKKTKKSFRKYIEAAPVVGSMYETGRGTLQGSYKRLSGTNAVHRTNASNYLALHFQSSLGPLDDQPRLCPLAELIITVLFKNEFKVGKTDEETIDNVNIKLKELREMKHQNLVTHLMEKLNSK
jgi:hypothetical protein